MLTFAQALAKYRADQARDERGRFTSEGGGRSPGNDFNRPVPSDPESAARRGRQSPRTTPSSFWSHKAPPTPGLEEAIRLGGISADTTWEEWEALSPGMRREIVRSRLKAKQDAELPDRMARYRRQTGLSTAAFIRETSIELGLKPPKRALSSANKFLAYVRSQGLTSDTIENGFAGVTRRYA